jgi:adenylate cyclase, class 2
MSTQSGLETEVKIPLTDTSAARARIESLGFQVSVARVFEANTIYDTARQTLRQANMLLRLRQAGERGVITWKGPSVAGPYKSRPEIETSVGSIESLDQILRQLGYAPMFRYEKYRTEFAAPDAAGTIVLDETPIGGFLELEGAGDWIDETAERLGFSKNDYVLDSYGKLFLSYKEKNGFPHSHMVFENALL